MVQCLCCKKNEANTITISGNWIIHICGLPECRHKLPNGQELTLGEWILDESEYGQYSMIKGLEEFTIEINHKSYTIPNDRRVIKGLHNKIKELNK